MSDSHQAIYDAVRSRISPCDTQSAIESAANTQLGGLSYLAQHAQQELYRVSEEHTRPSILFKPELVADGDHWMALYGPDLAVGVAGFGKTPDEAMRAFDAAWTSERTPAARFAAKQQEQSQ